MAISSGPEFEAALDTAVALWRRRAELLSEAERVSGGDDVLGEVEDEYRGRIAALAPRAEQHLPELEARLARKPGVQRASPACRWRSATNDAASRGFADVRNHDR